MMQGEICKKKKFATSLQPCWPDKHWSKLKYSIYFQENLVRYLCPQKIMPDNFCNPLTFYQTINLICPILYLENVTLLIR